MNRKISALRFASVCTAFPLFVILMYGLFLIIQLGNFFIIPYIILMFINLIIAMHFSVEEIEKIKNINVFMLIILLPYIVCFSFCIMLYFVFDLSVKNPFNERKDENELKD